MSCWWRKGWSRSSVTIRTMPFVKGRQKKEGKKGGRERERGWKGYKKPRIPRLIPDAIWCDPDAIDSPKSVPRRAHECEHTHTIVDSWCIEIESSVAGGTSTTALLVCLAFKRLRDIFFIKSVFVKWLCLSIYLRAKLYTHQWFLFQIGTATSDARIIIISVLRHEIIARVETLEFILLSKFFGVFFLSLFANDSIARFCYPLNFRAFWDSVYIEMAFTIMWRESWWWCSIENDTGEYRMRLYVRGITLADKEG